MSVLDDFRAYGDPALALHLPETVGPGIPLAVKDNIDVAGMPTTAACPSFSYQPAADATVVARLRSAGFAPCAKVNLDQFATGLVGTRSPAGVPRNPFDPARIPGGSSSGSACAVAAGLVPVSLGTDTAGSGRVPAACQGLVGFKPTKGWLSTTGVVPAVRSQDCVSVFARSLTEAWTVVTTAAGSDATDPFSRIRPDLPLPAGSLRIGVPGDAHLAMVDDGLLRAYVAAIDRLRALGHVPVPIELAPFLSAGTLLYDGAFVAERTAAVGDFLDGGPADADPTVAAIIRSGRRHDAVTAWRDSYALARLRQLADQQWQRMDLLILPTISEHPTIAAVQADPLGINRRMGRFTTFTNLLDLCAVALPAGRSGHLPAGITLMAPAWHDGLLARVGAQFLGESLPPIDDGTVEVAVFGAHLRGQPLNHLLVGWGGVFVGDCRTAARYRMHRVESPLRPGLVRVASDGAMIPGECWRLPTAGFGRFTASITRPLAIGTVELDDGRLVKGFVCEPVDAGEDLTRFGGWRAWLEQR